VFLAGLEEGLFPHQRSIASVEAIEEERRLCYVGMTRAQQRLYLTWARYRRRFGGGEQERTVASRFLSEVPPELVARQGEDDSVPQVDLHAERYEVRESARRNTFTGKTYNSLDNISQFFAERGVAYPAPKSQQVVPRPATTAKPLPPAPPPVRKSARTGMTVEHPKYGTGTVVRREGDGDDAKITVSFPRFGLKKLVEKYAGLKRN
jgi:DNA helicase-2/ATP-dependent DNA helicase PcrA